MTRYYAACAECDRLVRLNKPLLGALHFCSAPRPRKAPLNCARCAQMLTTAEARSGGLLCELCALPEEEDPMPEPRYVGDLEECPACGASWLGEPISEANREAYGGATHYRTLIGIYDRNLDRTVAWRCPDCGQRWDRGATVEEEA